MSVTITTNNRSIRLHGVLTIERETFYDARYNRIETTYYITTQCYEYMYFNTLQEHINSVIIERC